ncbi:MAG: hypothetical protein LBU62_11730 [Bacteroidales bacterium]|jgi:hypothetical protein|nr:hypothetical protein [Bacteroidales bacterium]
MNKKLILIILLLLCSCQKKTDPNFYNPFDNDMQYGKIEWVETEFFEANVRNNKIVEGVKVRSDIHRRQFFTTRQNNKNWHYYLTKREGYVSGMYDITINRQDQWLYISKLDGKGQPIESEEFEYLTDSTLRANVEHYYFKTNSVKLYQFRHQRPTREIWFNQDSLMTHDIQYTYDKHHFIQQREEINYVDKDTLKTVFECDKWGHPVKKSYYRNGNLYSQWTYQYELDKHKNWIRAIIYADDAPKYVAKQKFKFASVKYWYK